MQASELLLLQQERKELFESKDGESEKEKRMLEACDAKYTEFMESLIDHAIKEYTHPLSINYAPFLRIFRGYGNQMPLVPHYGYQISRDTFTLRDTSAWETYGLVRPFIKLQDKYQKLGYYLLDESDASKSFMIHINLWFIEPKHYGKCNLWHNLNILPPYKQN